MSKTKFLELVGQGVIPRPIAMGGVKIWDRHDLDAVIEAAKEDAPSERNSFDRILRR
jgi:predicted DNA-binding transcriptional regulator AlpA